MMKKILFLFIFVSLLSCSSSDDNEIIIKGSELRYGEGHIIGGYFLSDKYNIYLAHTDRTANIFHEEGISLLWGSNAICPNDHSHLSDPITIAYGSGGFTCYECFAVFELKTGNPINKQANGRFLDIYKYKYNIDRDEYTVWE